MAQLTAQFFNVPVYGVDNSPESLGVQFLNAKPNENGLFNSNYFQFGTDYRLGMGHGTYLGNGFDYELDGRTPQGGTVTSINVDFDGGNTPDVSVDLISLPLMDLFGADWAYYQNVVFGKNDRFVGSDKADVLYGYGGDDIMFGGTGDKLNYDPYDPPEDYETRPFEPGTTFDDMVYRDDGDDTLDGGAGNDTLDGGTGNDMLFGGDDNDMLFGGADNDYIDGGSGADDMDGGTGNDTYVVDDINDTVTEKAEEGDDTVFAFVSFALGQAVENLSLDGRASIDGVGNGLSNRIIGNVGDNKLEGLGGDDVIRGGQGNDTLDGGADNDMLFGGDDNDKLFGGRGEDILDGGSGTNVLDGGEGFDTASYASFDGDLVADFSAGTVSTTGGGFRSDELRSIETIVTGSGNDKITGYASVYAGSGNDRITGSSEAGAIFGEGGNDVIRVLSKGSGNAEGYGGAGHDKIYTSGQGYYYGGNGNDTIILAVTDPSVGAGLWGHSALGGSGIDTLRYDANRASMINNIDLATGQTHVPAEEFLEFENVVSGSGNDRIAGNGAANGLWGGDGKDLLVGRGGNDRVYGGNGKDKLYGGGGKDELTGNRGADLLVGGKGSDDFNFRKTSDSTRKSMDTIDGFGGAGRKGGDQIDVSRIDAVKGAKGNQKFDFDGGKGKGHLWAEDDGRDTIIYGNIDNDRFAEIQIRIEDGRNTSADDYFTGDFIL